MLELPKFGNMNTIIMHVESRGKILITTSWTEIMTS